MNWMKVILVGVIAVSSCIAFDAWVMRYGKLGSSAGDSSGHETAPAETAEALAATEESVGGEDDDEDDDTT